MSRYAQQTRLTGISAANTINYWFGGGFVNLPNLEYLVIAGGGGTGSDNGSGAGAGGYRTDATTFAFVLSTNYAVTVGAGGAGGAPSSNNGVKGVDSSFSTITSTGGGLGAGGNLVPTNQDGGSGGGATGNYNGAIGPYIGGISRDVNRVWNKIQGTYHLVEQNKKTFNEKLKTNKENFY